MAETSVCADSPALKLEDAASSSDNAAFAASAAHGDEAIAEAARRASAALRACRPTAPGDQAARAGECP